MFRLEQLRKWRETAKVMLQTLLARFTSGRNSSSAAEADVSRLELDELIGAQQAVRRILASEVDRALTLDALPAGDARLFGRTDLLQRLTEAIDAWRSGQPRMIACFGPRGSGISTLLNQVRQLAGPEAALSHHVLRQHLQSVDGVLAFCGELFELTPPPASVDDALDMLKEASPRIVVIDNAHYFTLRVSGNASVVRTLGMLMVASRDRHLWILGCNKEAWNRLIYWHGIDRYFTDSISLSLYNEQELTTMLEQRLGAADLRLEVDNDAGSEGGDDASTTALPGKQLFKLSSGHTQLAIALILNGLTSTDDPQRFTLVLPQQLSTKLLDALQPADLFTLAEIAVHGALDVAEHQTIFRSTLTDSQMLLADLCNRRLLCVQIRQNGGTETYSLHPIIAPQISDYLYRKNLLY